MKKSTNVDIHNLFRKFGGEAENYQEIQRDYYIDKSRQNWPLVMAMHKAELATVEQPGNFKTVVHAVLNPSSTPVTSPLQSVEQAKFVSPVRQASMPNRDTKAILGTVAKSTVTSTKKSAVMPPFRRDANSKGNPLNAMFKHLSDPEMKYDRSAAKRISAAGISRSGAEPLGDVFTHLLDKKNPSYGSLSEGGLRNLLGRLNKK